MDALNAAVSPAISDTPNVMFDRAALLGLYLAAALVCLQACAAIQRSFAERRAQARRPTRGYHRRRRFWRTAALLLAGGGIVVELGAAASIADRARVLAHDHGWYHHRWLVQGIALAVIATVFIALIIAICRRRAEWYPRDRWSLAALLALVFILGIRALSQHHTEVILSVDLLHVSLGRWLELSLLAALSTAALWTTRCRRGAHAAHGQLR